MAYVTLDHLFGRSLELAPLADHAARLVNLQETYASCLPDYLRGSSRVANYKLETLVIHADNSAVAAKLKQLEPRLRKEFSQLAWPISALQFRVQPRRPEPPPRVSDRDAHLPDCARRALSTLSTELPEDSPVRAALERMLANSG